MNKVSKEQLTAYALGELSHSEREEISKILQQNPDLQKEVDEIKDFGQFLSESFKEEAIPEMKEEHRQKVLNKTDSQSFLQWMSELLTARPLVVSFASFACLLVVVTASMQQTLQVEQNAHLSAVEMSDGDGSEVLEAEPESATKKPHPSVKVAQHTPKAEDIAALNRVRKDSPKEKAVVPSSHVVGAKFKDTGIKAKPRSKNLVAVKKGGALRTSKTVAKRGSSPRRLKKSATFAAFGSEESMAVSYGGRGETLALKARGRSYIDPLPHPSREAYQAVTEQNFQAVQTQPLSTFSVDVDTASYTNIRRYLQKQNSLPPKASVRIEEMINYFDYSDPAPKGDAPFNVQLEMASSPWSEGHKLVRIGIKGKTFPEKNPKSNLVFLVDVSGSMDNHYKLGLLKQGLHQLVSELDESDYISLVTYAGHSAVTLDSTSASEGKKIHEAIDNLTAGGSTHGSDGITTAYDLAKKNFRKEGVNRVILATDGDFNVGTTSDTALVDLVKEKAKSGIFLTVLGFGSGNLNDSMMEKISNQGNGNYFYLDSEKEAKRVLVEKLQGTLVTIAKDVKIQVEFNPENVAEYRLIGYENRQLAAKDFNDDKKDAGEIGAGHSVVALYEIKPKGFVSEGVDPLKYQKQKKQPEKVKKGKFSSELLTVKIRYKKPDGTKSELLSFPLQNSSKSFEKASQDFRWSTGVAGFGMLLTDSAFKGDLTYEKLHQILKKAQWSNNKHDPSRSELIELVNKAKSLSGQ